MRYTRCGRKNNVKLKPSIIHIELAVIPRKVPAADQAFFVNAPTWSPQLDNVVP
jgi:hypothetical protein